MGPSCWIFHQWKQSFERTVVDAEVTACTVFLHDGDHGLSHDNWPIPPDLILCVENQRSALLNSVKFIGHSPQPQPQGEGHERRETP